MIPEGNVFYRNGFIPKRTQPRGTLTPYPDFESGVVKIQRGESGAMNDAEKLACVSLLKVHQVAAEDEAAGAEVEEEETDFLDVVRAEEAAALKGNTSQYINCDFILGSVAEVERLWSTAKHILTEERRGMMHPILFEALLFLKENHRLWGLEEVVDAETKRKNGEDDNGEVPDDDDSAFGDY